MKSYIFTLIFISCISCNNTYQPSANKVSDTTLNLKDNTSQETSDSIELNNGAKWKVNDTMMAYIRIIEKNITHFNGSTLNDFEMLHTTIKSNIDLLTSSCTMTGKAHDELHKWLLPFIDLVDEFGNNKTIESQKSNLHNLKNSFIIFNTFFL